MIIEEGNYAAVIIAANEETGATREGKQWTRTRLYVDICRGVFKGYFTALKKEYPKDRYKGTVDMYTAPDGNTDALTPTQLQQIATNLNLICRYNGVDSVDKLPQDWTGLIVGIRVKKDEIGCASVSGWLVDGVDVTFADTVVSNYYNPNDDTQHTLPTLSTASNSGRIVDPKKVNACGNLAARRRAMQSAKAQEQEKQEEQEKEDVMQSLAWFGVSTEDKPKYNYDYTARVRELMDAEIYNSNYDYAVAQAKYSERERMGDILRMVETEENSALIRQLASKIDCMRWWEE